MIFPKAPYSKILTWQVCLFHSRGSDLKIILKEQKSNIKKL